MDVSLSFGVAAKSIAYVLQSDHPWLWIPASACALFRVLVPSSQGT